MKLRNQIRCFLKEKNLYLLSNYWTRACMLDTEQRIYAVRDENQEFIFHLRQRYFHLSLSKYSFQEDACYLHMNG